MKRPEYDPKTAGYAALGLMNQGLSKIPPHLRGKVLGQTAVQKCAFCKHWNKDHPKYVPGVPCPGCQGSGYVLVGVDAAGRPFCFGYRPDSQVSPDELKHLKKINKFA